MEKYEKVRKIGQGTFGDVLLVSRKSDQKVKTKYSIFIFAGQLFAMKRVPFEQIDGKETKDINNEVSITTSYDI